MDNQEEKPLSFKEMLQSLGAAALGVQTGKNRARDFSRGKPSHFIILGIVFTLIFVLILIAIVKLALHAAGV